MQPHMVENTGSTARDFCMLERNILSHLKLALLLSLLSSSLLLQARLVPGQDNEKSKSFGLPLASVEFFAALAAVVGGVWEYYSGYWDLRNARAFLVAVKPHFVIIRALSYLLFTSGMRDSPAIQAIAPTVVSSISKGYTRRSHDGPSYYYPFYSAALHKLSLPLLLVSTHVFLRLYRMNSRMDFS